MNLKDIPGFLRPFFKLTADSKTPTDLELDEHKQQLAFLFPTIRYLFKTILKEEINRFVKYRWKKMVGWSVAITVSCAVIYLVIALLVVPFINNLRHKGAPIKIQTTVYRIDLLPFDSLVKKVGFRESGGNWDTVNQYGMQGYFQFDPSTLRLIGINVSKKDFLENKELQKGAFIQLLKENKRTYKDYIYKFNNKNLPNCKCTITESGILMAFHLKPSDACAYFDSNGRNRGRGDANGTPITHYIEKFSGYEIPF